MKNQDLKNCFKHGFIIGILIGLVVLSNIL